jgi:hypothetical protein
MLFPPFGALLGRLALRTVGSLAWLPYILWPYDRSCRIGGIGCLCPLATCMLLLRVPTLGTYNTAVGVWEWNLSPT